MQTNFGAGGGSRTHTNVTSQDFESCASANSATPAYLFSYLILIYNNKVFLKFQVVSKIILNYFRDHNIINIIAIYPKLVVTFASS